MFKLSVIIPVYNVEDYIEECIKSLLQQTLDKMEIIFIDDGSSDNSINIIKKYINSNIVILSQVNKGQSAARNLGLKYARGKYIMFVDSDDFIANSSSLEKMYIIANKMNKDVVCGNAYKYYPDNTYEKFNDSYSEEILLKSTGEDYLLYCLKNHNVFSPVWLYMFRREFLLERNLYFKEGVYHEDELFTAEVFLSKPEIIIYNEISYIYRIREGSTMTNQSIAKKRGTDLFIISLEIKEKIDKIENKELRLLYLDYFANHCLQKINSKHFNQIPFKVKLFIIKNLYNNNAKIKAISLLLGKNYYSILHKIYEKLT